MKKTVREILIEYARAPGTWFVVIAIAWTLYHALSFWPNNFLIYRTATRNLYAGRDLYVAYPASHFDLYKYSPAFAFLFAPFAYLPILPALIIWTVLSTAAFVRAISKVIPGRADQAICLALLLLPYMNPIRGAQTNAIVVSLIILAAVALEREHPARASLAIAGGAAIKLFPLAAAPMALMHPRRLRFAAAGLIAGAALVLLPAAVIGTAGLVAEYHSWFRIESLDALDRGYSVMGVAHDWLGVTWPNWVFQLAGAIVLVLPIALRRDRWNDVAFRRKLLGSVLMFVVLFNHQAEYESYLIAATGWVIWVFWSRRLPARWILTALAMIALHPFPYFLAWIVLQMDLLRGVSSEMRELNVSSGQSLPNPP